MASDIDLLKVELRLVEQERDFLRHLIKGMLTPECCSGKNSTFTVEDIDKAVKDVSRLQQARQSPVQGFGKFVVPSYPGSAQGETVGQFIPDLRTTGPVGDYVPKDILGPGLELGVFQDEQEEIK
jgi:hypothetical protein